MGNTSTTPADRSLLDEIEELHVLEAEELQEGVAFHAFRFSAAPVLEALTLTVHGDPTPLAKTLDLPHGATLMDVIGSKMRILFDPTAVKATALQETVTKTLGKHLASAEHNAQTKFTISEKRA